MKVTAKHILITISLLVAGLFVGCSGVKPLNSKVNDKDGAQTEKKADGVSWKKTIEPQTITIKPGEASLLRVPGEFKVKGTLSCDGKVYKYYVRGNELISFVSETYFSKLKPYECHYFSKENKKGDKIKVADVIVKVKDFPS